MPAIIMHQSVANADLTPDQHLERDHQLFHHVEAGSSHRLCRFWETAEPVVVVGRSSSIDADVQLRACHADGVPVLRRFSGGGSVVLGPGCVNYAIALSLVSRADLLDVAASFRIILEEVIEALGVPGLSIAGVSDLALHGRKISGNAQRRGRRALMQHGTLLCGFDAGLAARYLTEPLRQPSYRAARRHGEFLGNLPMAGDEARARLARAWAD